MRRWLCLVFTSAVFCVSSAAWGEPSGTPPPAAVVATVVTTLETAADRIRQFAFDGDGDTFFASAQNAAAGDHFTLLLDEPVSLKSIVVSTGRPDGADRLGGGLLEVSRDGQEFEELAAFAEGAARAEPNGRQVQAIRIRAKSDLPHALVVREFTVASQPPLAVFKYPIEFVVDAADAPDMRDWAVRAARICERAYPMINEELASDGYRPPRLVTLSMKTRYGGVAATSGDRITGSVTFFKEHPDDVGAMVHETVHVVQQYRRGNNPGWLVEGVADYVRFFKFEPGKLGPIDAERAHYNGSYRVTAAFLAYLAENYDPHIVRKLNQRMRDGEYKDEVFQQFTGKMLAELDEEWRATLQ